MSKLTIVLGNKTYSSWSLRAWLALKQTGQPFEEVVIPLDRPETQSTIRTWSEAGKVPILRDGGLVIWDSLAICEYLAERHPDAGLWPEDAEARAVARAAAAEMHAGFKALRKVLPMDVHRRKDMDYGPEVAADIARICSLWSECRTRFGRTDGDFLFGRFTIADAFYAPVASRFVTYGVSLPEVAKAYVESVMTHPAMTEWQAAAAEEPWVIENP